MKTNSKNYWQQQFEAWQGTTTSKKAFCLEHGLSYPSFTYWSRKFTDLSEEKPLLQAVAVSFTQALSPDLACLQRVSDLCINTAGIEIPYAEGQARITITGQISMLALSRLVEAATGASSNVQA